jgi:hypothetical protein
MKLAQLILIAAAGRLHAECVAGDLEEEFASICLARGRSAGNRWYVSQVIRSIVPLAGVWLQGALLRMLCAVAIPLVLVDRLWRFVYSQIPLKEAAVRSTRSYVISMTLIAAAGSIAIWRRRSAK